MHRKILVQGLTDRTYADEVRWVLSTPDIQKALISVAFLNEEGVIFIEEMLSPLAGRITFYCGIRNDITSYQGLLRLISSGHKVFTVDTGSRGRIFHPKIYFASGPSEARLSIGSGNLTLGGLNNNIEAGMGAELDLQYTDDKAISDDLENIFNDLIQRYPENITLLDDKATLDRIKNSGILLDEAEISPPRPSRPKATTETQDSVPRIRLPIELKYPTIRKTRERTQPVRPPTNETIPSTSISTNLQKVWQSKPLTERDLTIPSADGTHQTGSINLDKGLLDEHIDHRHYFRNDIFSDLDWQPRSNGTVEEATGIFQLVIKDKIVGEYELPIRHTTSTTSTSYLQRNAMTRLSWGEMRELIAKPDYIGRTLTLYVDEANQHKYVLEID